MFTLQTETRSDRNIVMLKELGNVKTPRQLKGTQKTSIPVMQLAFSRHWRSGCWRLKAQLASSKPVNISISYLAVHAKVRKLPQHLLLPGPGSMGAQGLEGTEVGSSLLQEKGGSNSYNPVCDYVGLQETNKATFD